MKTVKGFAFILLLLVLPLLALTGQGHAQVMTKTDSGMRAVIKADPSKSMVDLYLYDAKTGSPVMDAKVKAVIKAPDGVVIEKDLMGMKMGEGFSYMNSLDMSRKGKYSFTISVETPEGKARFDFEYDK